MADKKSKKKPKVIHTRVTADMEKELKDKAAELGISVSNLVRNVIMNTFDLVENIVDDSFRVAGSARNLKKRRPKPAYKPEGDIIGWQEMILNLNAICIECNQILPKGCKAVHALPIASNPKKIMCIGCLDDIQNEND